MARALTDDRQKRVLEAGVWGERQPARLWCGSVLGFQQRSAGCVGNARAASRRLLDRASRSDQG